MRDHKILIATDVPFWRRSTGAEQRIAAIVDFLTRHSIVVKTFFVSEIEPADEVQIRVNRLDVVPGSSELPPADRTKRILWFGEATLNQFRLLLQQDKSKNQNVSTLRLSDFHWPWAVDQFKQCVNEFEPDSILIEYIKLSYLGKSLSRKQRSHLKLMIDTHDALHLRNEQFSQRGYPHWLSISKAEEAEALRPFDFILAIQPSEAALFREMAPDSQTIVVGHSLEHQIPDSLINRQPDNQFIVGYIGSANFSNSSAVSNLLSESWEKTCGSEVPIRFRIAGSVCEWLATEFKEVLNRFDNIELTGQVADLSAFYESVDVAINPVEFGTGLKIKNCEALCYGVPLLTTRNGVQTMPAGSENFTIVVDSHAHLVEEICRLAREPSRLAKIKNQLSTLARPLFSDQAAYSELLEALRS